MENLQGSAARSRVHVLAVNGKKTGFPTVSAGVLQSLLAVLRKVRKLEKRAVRERAALREFGQTYLFDDREPCMWPECGCGVHDCAAQRGEKPQVRPCEWSPLRAKHAHENAYLYATGMDFCCRLHDIFRDGFGPDGIDAPIFIASGSMRKLEGAFEAFPAPYITMRTVLDL